MLTSVHDGRVCEEAVMRGASGLVHKLESPGVISKAISQVHAGELWLEPHMLSRVFAALSMKGHAVGRSPASRAKDLTDRERQIIGVVVKHKGARAKVIADALHISSNTLRNHLATIYRKLGIHSRIDLILYAMRTGVNNEMQATTLDAKESTRWEITPSVLGAPPTSATHHSQHSERVNPNGPADEEPWQEQPTHTASGNKIFA